MIITKPLYEKTQDLIINTGVNWTITKLKGLLPFALPLVILNLHKPLKLKDRTLNLKEKSSTTYD
jgi:hypothetical protein